MRKLLNTLYITSEDIYLSLDGENVVANLPDDTRKPFPLHGFESIVSFSYKGASPALMGKCVEMGISIAFYSPRGRFLALIGNETAGNVHLRRTQFRIADDEAASVAIARDFIVAKLYNAKNVLLRCARDHGIRLDVEKLRSSAEAIGRYMKDAAIVENMDRLRGIEGNAAAEYFQVFDEMILQDKEAFSFDGRSRRPPKDRVNAMLSFAYSLLTSDCASALRGVGLDPYVGFMHADRPGRKSLSLDLVEELRAVFADRFVLTLINNRVLNADDFLIQDSGAVLMKDSARRTFLNEWQKRKKEPITHPFLDEKIAWGQVPYVQALLLARFVRGDLDAYPPFFWK
ncbi:MAG: type I-C CRISPR-associated endonuclease Cas1c [Christensenellales bacterium]|jgi:CRISPR-associated protein Cas1